MSKRKANVAVVVNGPIEKALRQLKKKAEREGVPRDQKKNAYFESKSSKKRKKLMRAIKNNIMRMLTQNPQAF